MSPPLESETEITGPMALKLYVSSSTVDADLFVTVQAFSPDDREVEFQGTIDPHTPLAQGWLRASHRKLDKVRSLPYRPYHLHDDKRPLRTGLRTRRRGLADVHCAAGRLPCCREHRRPRLRASGDG
jgi:predicted acyl esterase